MTMQPVPSRPVSSRLAWIEELPHILVTVLERRYLSDFQPQHWQITAQPEDLAWPLLREVLALGRPQQPQEWIQAMPHVLNACYETGHALLMALHGDGERQRLYLGGRRLPGRGAHSTEDYLASQESAFKAYFNGLELSAPRSLNGRELPALADWLQTAPALAVLTGIPAPRPGAEAGTWQGLDRLVRALGNRRYALLVVAEPVPAWEIDAALDACRHLTGEIHSYIRSSRATSEGTSETESTTYDTRPGDELPVYLQAVGSFFEVVGRNEIAGALRGLGALLNAQELRDRRTEPQSRQQATAITRQESTTLEILDANAEACEALLQTYSNRLLAGRSQGWWRTACYVAAEDEGTRQSVLSALRSLAAGPASVLDPLRPLELPAHQLRPALVRGQVLTLKPAASAHGHPLGAIFDTLGTCLNSEELAVLIHLPPQELPGLPMRDHGEFALSAPETTVPAVHLGRLQDGLGRDLGELTLTPAELNRHCFVTGATGYGKTNTCMQLLLEAYTRLQIPFLVIEPVKAEYRRLATALQGQLRVYTVGGDSPLPFRLNPFELLPGIPLGRHIDLLKAVFNASFPMAAGMPYVLEEALLDIYQARGWSLYTSQNLFLGERPTQDERYALMPCLADLHDQIERVLERKRYAQEVHQNMGAALRSRLRSLMVGNKGLALNTRRGIPLATLFTAPTVIELKNLGDDEEKSFVMALLFTFLYEYAETRQARLPAGERETLQHLTLIEEAHRLLKAAPDRRSPEMGDPAAKAVAMFTDMLAEMRAYGEGFIIADQIPTKLTPETLKNTGLKIAHRLIAADDRQAIGSSLNLEEAQIRHLNNLKPGQAVIHDERIGAAVLVQVYPAKETQAPLTADSGFTALNDTGLDPSYLYRHAGCRGCPAPCQFYYQLENLVRRGVQLPTWTPLFEGLLLGEPPAQVWETWRALWQSCAWSHPPAGPGLAFCAVTQATYEWLQSWLLQRQRGETLLSPAEQLRLENAAKTLSALWPAWLARLTEPALDEAGTAIYEQATRRLHDQIATAPPVEWPGCEACLARCRLLPWVAPVLPAVEKGLVARLPDLPDPAGRLELVRRLTDPYFPWPALKATPRHRDWLYCLLTHTLPATFPGRATFLAAVKEL